MKEENIGWHSITLDGSRVRLCPFRESDWDLLFKSCNDPKVLYYPEGDDVEGYELETVKQMYRPESRDKFCFMIEFEDKAVGECWLQRMNLIRVLKEYPDLDFRRIDLTIGEKHYWGHGLGAETISLGFTAEKADLIFACDIHGYNPRSMRAFKRVGFVEHAKLPGDRLRSSMTLCCPGRHIFE